MSYPQPGYQTPPVSSKSGILVTTLLTTIAVAIAAVAFFALSYVEDTTSSVTYWEFIDLSGSLVLDASITGGGLVLALLSAWLIYAQPLGGAGVFFRVLMVLGGIVGLGGALMNLFLAKITNGPTIWELTQEGGMLSWGLGQWVIVGASAVVFILSITMLLVVSSYRKKLLSAQRYGQPW